MEEKEIIAPFINFIAKATLVRPYPADEDISLPSTDFISVRLTEMEPVSWTVTEKSIPKDTCIPEQFTQYMGEVRVTAYGDKAYSYLSQITKRIRDDRYVKLLQDDGIAYSGHTPVRNSSIPIDNTKTEKRFTMLIHFYFVMGEESLAGEADVIETVQPPLYIGEYII